MSTTIYYSYKASEGEQAVEVVAEQTAESEQETEAPGPEVQEESESAEEPEPPQPAEEGSETGELSGTVDVEIPPLRYEIVESGSFIKAEIQQVTLIVKNGLSREVSPTVKVFAFDSSSTESHKTYPKDTLILSTIASGGESVKSYDVKNINLYNFDLAKTIRFEFYDEEDTQLAVLSKTITIED